MPIKITGRVPYSSPVPNNSLNSDVPKKSVWNSEKRPRMSFTHTAINTETVAKSKPKASII